jgi:hypothetical protein
MDGVPLDPNSITSFTAGTTHNISLFPDAGSLPGFFRGFLFRFGPVVTGAVNTIPDLNPFSFDTEVAVLCGPCFAHQVSGLCHQNGNNKTIAQGALMVATATSGLILDVNVVVSNRNNISEYFYNYFLLTAVSAGSPTGAIAVTPSPTPGGSSSGASPVTTTTAPSPATVTTAAPSPATVTTAAPSPATVTTTAPSPATVATTPAPSPAPVAPTATPVVISTLNSTTPKSSSITQTSAASGVVAGFAWIALLGSVFIYVI